jgi:Transposase DDE domain group 1
MQTQCNPIQMEFAEVERRRVVAAFDGGTVSSDGGVLLLARTDEAIGLIDRLAGCFRDRRAPALVEHAVRTLVGQRVFGIAAGYEDLNDHDELRKDPLWGALMGKLTAKRRDCQALAGKSTLNRLEWAKANGTTRYQRIEVDAPAIEALFVTLFLESYAKAPEEIVLDLDATDDPLHGDQEGRFFHGYYDHYCYLPLYIFCGRHLLCAKLRPANIDGAAGAKEEVERIVAQIRARWPETRIILRADSGFAREGLMAWCEGNGVDYVFGLARNGRLERWLQPTLERVAEQVAVRGQAAREFLERSYRTLTSWSCARRVVGKAEVTTLGSNPRFVVTSLSVQAWDARALYEDLYCARGEMENRIKEAQLELFADRTSTHLFRANQLRLWFSSFAYTLIEALRRLGLAQTQFARAGANRVRLCLLKIGAVITVSVRRVKVALSSACPWQEEFLTAFESVSAAAR